MTEREELFLTAGEAEKFVATKRGGYVDHVGVVYVARYDDSLAASPVGGSPAHLGQAHPGQPGQSSTSAEAAIAAAKARK